MKIVEALNNNQAVIIEEYFFNPLIPRHDKGYNYYKNIRKWSTYDRTCIQLDFSPVENKDEIICGVKIYDGEILNGTRKDLRFHISILLEKEFVLNIQDTIEYVAIQHARSEYEQKLLDEERAWVDDRLRDIDPYFTNITAEDEDL
jgi:hypothetical protein